MNLRKLTSWFPELSYRQKVVSLILSGVIVGLGGLFWVSPKTQLQAYPLKHTISQAYIKRKEYLSLL